MGEGQPPKAEKITDKLAAKEQEIQGATKDNKDIVRQEDVDTKVKALTAKIDASPLDTANKDTVKKALGDLQDRHIAIVDKIKNDGKQELIKACGDITRELDALTKGGNIGEIFQNVEPLFQAKDKVAPIISLKTYAKGSGYWSEINKQLATAGIDEAKVKYLQKNILNVDDDGHVGPKTMNAMGKLLGIPVDVKFGTKNTGANGQEITWDKSKDTAATPPGGPAAATPGGPAAGAAETAPQQFDKNGLLDASGGLKSFAELEKISIDDLKKVKIGPQDEELAKKILGIQMTGADAPAIDTAYDTTISKLGTVSSTHQHEISRILGEARDLLKGQKPTEDPKK